MNRLQQLTANNPDSYLALARFEQQVPAQATVALLLQGDSFEYPLFGEYLTRTLIPLNSFHHGIQPIPAHADYLLYDTGFGCAPAHIEYIGYNWCLHELPDHPLSTSAPANP